MTGELAERVSAVRRLKLAETQHLLGDTIAIADDEWRARTALPGWTRGHLATHVARNADLLRHIVTRAQAGQMPPEYPSPVDEMRELEEGSRRSPLDLQIDLDTSSGRLNMSFDTVTPDQWSIETETPWGRLRLADLPIVRLMEIVVHHVDLDTGYTFASIDNAVATILLEWYAGHHSAKAVPQGVRITSSTGFTAVLGESETPVYDVTGSATNLLGWLLGRLERQAVEGAEHLSLELPR